MTMKSIATSITTTLPIPADTSTQRYTTSYGGPLVPSWAQDIDIDVDNETTQRLLHILLFLCFSHGLSIFVFICRSHSGPIFSSYVSLFSCSSRCLVHSFRTMLPFTSLLSHGPIPATRGIEWLRVRIDLLQRSSASRRSFRSV